jgi:hypothetical protein
MALTRPPVVNPFANTVAGTPSDFWDVPVTYDDGFTAPGGTPVKPELSDVNWLFWLVTLGVRYLLSRAFTPWDSTETQYTVGSMVIDSNGRFYVCRGTATTGTHPSADPTNWYPLTMLDRLPNAGTGGDWVSKIAQWMNPRGLRQFAINRWGLPEGAFYQHTEMWSPNTDWASWLSLSGNIGHWKFSHTGSGSTLVPHDAGSVSGQNSSNTAPSLELVVDGSVVNNNMTAAREVLSRMSADSLMIADFYGAFVNDFTNYSFVMGFMAVGSGITSISTGAFFFSSPGSPNWQCKTTSSGSTSADSGIPVVVGVPHDFRVTLEGSNSDDGVVARALFYIDGALVANATVNVPTSAGSPAVGGVVAGGWLSGSTGANKSMVLGPQTYTQITKLATP